MLVGVVLISVPLAYVAHKARVVAAHKSWISEHPPRVQMTERYHPTLSWLRLAMGDEPQRYVTVPTEAERLQAGELFPEAHVYVFDSGATMIGPAK